MAEDKKQAEQATEQTTESGLFELTLKKPFEYDGRKLEKLTFDFEGLTGQDVKDINRELRRLGMPNDVAAFNDEFKIRYAAKACVEGIGSDAFDLMGAKDYLRITNNVQLFLIRSE